MNIKQKIWSTTDKQQLDCTQDGLTDGVLFDHMPDDSHFTGEPKFKLHSDLAE